jgi:hypothetical protein
VLQTPRGAVYCVSQRAEHIWEGVSSATTRSRPIINTRDEPHADAERYRRLHVIVGDSNMSETTMLLKVGATDLVLRMVEAGGSGSGRSRTEIAWWWPSRTQSATMPDSVWVTFLTVTAIPRTVVSKGTSRLSSIITAKPPSCSSSPYASTVASSTSASSSSSLSSGMREAYAASVTRAGHPVSG